MKRLILISTIFASVAGHAQNNCGAGSPMFRTDNMGTPKEVTRLGSNPEFPFLRNLSTPEQVAAAMKSSRHANSQLNGIMMNIGFANGVKDVQASNITASTIPAGTVGNMGDGNYSTSYVTLNADGGMGTKAWKVTGPAGCYVYFLNTCGNAFYPTTGKTTACINVPLNLSGTSKEVTLENSATQTTNGRVFVYYRKKHKRTHSLAPEFADLRDENASQPIMVNFSQKVEAIPQTYRVTLSSTDNNVTVCEDKPLDVTANINIEKTGSYSGFYPSKTNKTYKQVSKHVYKKTEKKIRKAERKERKVARLTHLAVKTEVAAR